MRFCFPVGAIPKKTPLWVPTSWYLAATLSPSHSHFSGIENEYQEMQT